MGVGIASGIDICTSIAYSKELKLEVLLWDFIQKRPLFIKGLNNIQWNISW